MTVSVTFQCDGCSTETGPHTVPHRKFRSFDGKGWGFGVWEDYGIEHVVPDGWIYPDPYTGCTYCPECWDSIVREAG